MTLPSSSADSDSTVIQVRVPCSTSNLGPGFDCLGMAFQLHNIFEFRVLEKGQDSSVTFTGPEKGNLSAGPNSLFFRAMKSVERASGKTLPPVSVTAEVHVPNARGLGSSSTAVVGGIVGANALLGSPLDSDHLLQLATKMEGHPDNSTPAMMGGLTASVMRDDYSVIYTKWAPSEKFSFLVLSPAYEVPTHDARAVLPKSLSLEDAVANNTRVPLLIDALVEGKGDRLAFLTQDRMHEPYRETLFRYPGPLKQAAFQGGALSVTISGAGPSILAICPHDRVDAIQKAWNETLAHLELKGQIRVLRVDMKGAVAEVIESRQATKS